MSRRLVAAAAIAAAAAVALLGAIWVELRPGPKAHARASANTRNDTEDSLRAQLAAANSQLHLLETKKASANSGSKPMGSPAGSPARLRQASMPIPGNVPEEVAAAEAKHFANYYTVLDQKRLAEAPDRAWAATIEKGAAAALTGDPPVPGTRYQKIECGATLCRIEATHETEIARRMYMTLFPNRLGEELNHGSIFAPVNELKTVAYFSRKGSQMPPPPSESGEQEMARE